MSLAARVSQVLKGRTVQNLLALYGVQFANYLLPLLTLPYLARVMGPSGFGVLAVGQSLAQYFSLVVEYGYSLSATREVAQNRDDPGRLARILSGVLGARLFLSLIVTLLAWGLGTWIPVLREHPALLWSGVFWAIALGFSPIWYFQGRERLRKIALVEVLTKAMAVVGIFALVRAPVDAYKVMLLQGLASFVASGVAWVWAWREVGFLRPKFVWAYEALRLGWRLFFSIAATTFYTSANSFILGIFVSPQQVGYYAGAERLTRALLSLAYPLNRVYLPRLSYLVNHDPPTSQVLFKRNTLFMFLLGISGVALVWIFAPLVTRLFLGEQYTPSVMLMRLLSLILLPVALANVWGIQWMLAHRLDRDLNGIYIVAGLLGLGFMLVLVPQMGAVGVVVGVIVAEFFGTFSMAIVLNRRGLWPFGRQGEGGA